MPDFAATPITIDMLRDDKAYKIFYYNLLCWANRKDNVSLQDYLNSLSQLVAKNNQKVPQTFNGNSTDSIAS